VYDELGTAIGSSATDFVDDPVEGVFVDISFELDDNVGFLWHKREVSSSQEVKSKAVESRCKTAQPNLTQNFTVCREIC
jgi:hypothetical protein